MSEEQLQKLLEEGDDRQCADFFQGMPEKQRRAFAPICIKWFRTVSGERFIETRKGTFTRNMRVPVSSAAVFATATFSELKKLGWSARPDGDLSYEMLLDRRPKWLNEYVTLLLEEDHYWNNWTTIRRLIATGLIERPEHPNYFLGLISGAHGGGGLFNNDATIETTLRNDPELLNDEIWKLFEYEGAGENSLANWDRFTRGGTWSDALLVLEQSGELPRARLLSCSLDALDRDFNHYRAKWFASFHDALKPTDDEQRAFADRYLQLLGVSAPNIVSWAFRKVEALSKQDVFDGHQLIDGLRPVLASRQKGIVKKALKLLTKTAAKSTELAAGAAVAATIALGHEEPDVQKAAIDVLDRFGSADNTGFVDRLAEYAAIVAPSERARLEKWLGADAVQSEAESPPAAFELSQLEDFDSRLLELYRVHALVENLQTATAAIPAADFDGLDIPRLHSNRQVVPINDFDELIEVCARVIEDDSDIDDVERVLDGLSRLCGSKPDDFEQRMGPLLKRTTHRLKKDMVPFIGLGASHDVSGLIYAWCTGVVLEGQEKLTEHENRVVEFTIDGETRSYLSDNLRKGIGYLSRHVLEIARRAAAEKAVPRLCTPTHQGGWIDPRVFVDRVNGYQGDDPENSDVCLALLRLAPDGRAEALSRLKKSSSEWGRAVQYALGGKGGRIGKTPALWIAAARCRAPWADDPKVMKAFPEHGPDAGQAATFDVRFPTDSYRNTSVSIKSSPPPPRKPDADCVTVTLHAQRSVGDRLVFELGTFGGRSVGSVRWTASIWPQARESFCAGAVRDLGANLDWWEAQWQNKSLLEPLLDSGTPLKPIGLLLLCTGLGAKDPGEHGLATDVAIGAIDDGRLGSDNFGATLARLLPTGLIKPARWQKRLADVARISEVHAAVVQQALQYCFEPTGADPPRDFAKLLELLQELSIDLGQSITAEPCRAFLASLKGSGKGAKLAKALLALPASDPSRTALIVQQALECRLTAIRNLADS